MKIKIWVDDVRHPPTPEYVWCLSVEYTKRYIEAIEHTDHYEIEVIDLDHDAGAFFSMGGDYIKILDWLEETGRNYPIRIHSMNPVGRGNMRAIIRKNHWKEID